MLSNIFAGLIASFSFLLLGLLWKSHISLWLRNLRYSGIDVSGRWTVDEDEITARGYKLTVPTRLTVDLKQVADELSGEAIAEIDHPLVGS